VAVIALVAALTARVEAAPGDVLDDPRERPGGVGADPSEPSADDVAAEVPYSASSLDERVRFDGPCDCDAPTLTRVAATGPSLASLIAHAQQVAGLDREDDPTRGWRRRSRWSALIPYVSARAGSGQSWHDVFDPALAAATSPSGPATLNHSLSYDVRLAWRLDHLLYDPNEPRFTAFELGRRRERRKLAALTSRAYFVWLRASVAVERDARWQLRLSEAAAELDALTDGWFTEQLARRESR
jgi:hypothetical protein